MNPDSDIPQENRLRVLYLGFAFPPGVAALYPGINAAGHALETQMVAELRRHFEVRSCGILPIVPPRLNGISPDSGIDHELVLVEKAPELFYRYRSLARLKAQYRRWRADGWEPDALLVYNLSPIYNQFLLWLRRQRPCPKLVLLLLDSPHLGQPTRWSRQLRRRFKPMCVPDAEMLPHFDACIALSPVVERYFRPRQVPFLWMPGGCTPARALRERDYPSPPDTKAPVRFGYFGSLGAHSGVKRLAEVFAASSLRATLEMWGGGKQRLELATLASRDERLRFGGLLSPAECLRFGRLCDVLVNPRPVTHGNENNFASKLFEYALTGRAILTAKLSGVEEVLGPEAFYFDPCDFSLSLEHALLEIGTTPRAELDRRGAAIQRRVVQDFSWELQASRMARFMQEVCAGQKAEQPELREALAA